MIRYLPQWLNAQCVRPAVNSLGRQIAHGLLGGILAAADNGDNIPVILSEAKNLCSQFSTASLEKVQRCFASAQHDNGKIKSPDTPSASGDLSYSQFTASAQPSLLS
jgi:hypothetical protein